MPKIFCRCGTSINLSVIPSPLSWAPDNLTIASGAPASCQASVVESRLFELKASLSLFWRESFLLWVDGVSLDKRGS
jgi:hypothetical protein